MSNTNVQAKLDAIFNSHMSAELAGDLDQTLATMAPKMDWRLPGVEPTGKRVEAVFVVIVGIEDDICEARRRCCLVAPAKYRSLTFPPYTAAAPEGGLPESCHFKKRRNSAESSYAADHIR